MRILLVHQPVDGGVARHITDLFGGLRADGHDVVLCGPQPPVGLRGCMTADELAPLALQRAVAAGPDTAAVRGLARIISAVRPDVVHAHSSKAGAVARIARLAHPRTPVLYTPHGYAMAGFFERELERTAYREAERGLGLLTSRVIAVCKAEARLARRVTLGRRVRIVHNGIATPPDGASDPRVEAIRARGPVIAAVSLLRPGKGLETLIGGWPRVHERHPRAQLVIAGDGPLRAELEQRAAAAGAGETVHFLGEHPDPIAVLRAADGFVLSSWAEAFPYAVLEAMVLGLGIVACDVGGIGEAIEHRITGLLVPARDPAALAHALTELLTDDVLRRRLGTSALDTVTHRFSIEAMVSGVAAVYGEVASTR